jgi:hypothetical protein
MVNHYRSARDFCAGGGLFGVHACIQGDGGRRAPFPAGDLGQRQPRLSTFVSCEGKKQREKAKERDARWI